MVEIGNRLAQRTQATHDPVPPGPGEVALFLLTPGGLRVLRAPISAKFAPDDPLISLLREQGTLINALRAAPTKGFAIPG